MGNKQSSSTNDENSNFLSKYQFNFVQVIGKGGFSKVWKVCQKKTKTYFAMKEMSKTKFIINMICAFQDRENLFLVMDLINGGDLRYHINRKRKFNEEQTSEILLMTEFFIACIVVALEYIHSNGILHRDIKPENLVFDEQGYLRTTDFGIARIWKPENYNETSGTPGYMAPEVLCRQNHGIAVDYFATGVIGFECMMGMRPYRGRNRKEIRDMVLAKQIQIRKSDIPPGWSLESADFVNKMIQRKPGSRLGTNGPEEVKGHPWFRNFPWDDLLKKEIVSPFIPNSNEDNFHNIRTNSNENDKDPETFKQNAMLLRRNSIQELFLGYDLGVPNEETGEYDKKSNRSFKTHKKSASYMY